MALKFFYLVIASPGASYPRWLFLYIGDTDQVQEKISKRLDYDGLRSYAYRFICKLANLGGDSI